MRLTALCLLLLAAACGSPADRPAGEEAAAGSAGAPAAIPVAVSVPPLAWLVEAVAGERVAVTVLIPPGRSPHSFEPGPASLRRAAAARLTVTVGHPSFPLEDRLLGPLAAAGQGGRRVALAEIAARRGIDLGDDPHPWLSPPLLAAAAEELTPALAELAEGPGSAAIAERGRAAVAALEALDRELAARLAAASCRTFLTYHPAWGSFAGAYGLTQLAIEREGKEPGPASLDRVVKQARQAGIRRLLIEPGRPPRTAQVIGETLGAEVVPVDPMARRLPEELLRVAELIAGGCAAAADDENGRPPVGDAGGAR